MIFVSRFTQVVCGFRTTGVSRVIGENSIITSSGFCWWNYRAASRMFAKPRMDDSFAIMRKKEDSLECRLRCNTTRGSKIIVNRCEGPFHMYCLEPLQRVYRYSELMVLE